MTTSTTIHTLHTTGSDDDDDDGNMSDVNGEMEKKKKTDAKVKEAEFQSMKANELFFSRSNLLEKPQTYAHVTSRPCFTDPAQTLTKTEAQQFAKLRWKMDNVTINQKMILNTTKPTRAICAQMRRIPTLENVLHAYYTLLVRIGTIYDAFRANPNYMEARHLQKWYAVHIARANHFYNELLACVELYDDKDNVEMFGNGTEQFQEVKNRMEQQLPALSYV